jgi:hypothetical protein
MLKLSLLFALVYTISLVASSEYYDDGSDPPVSDPHVEDPPFADPSIKIPIQNACPKKTPKCNYPGAVCK